MIVTQKQTATKSKQLQKRGKTVGLCVGYFDVLNVRHARLFKFAKTKVDVLIVGVEQDQSCTWNMTGIKRPIDKLELRLELLEQLKPIDIIYVMDHCINFKKTKNAPEIYKKMFKQISPTHLITNTVTDKHFEKKKQHANQLGIEFVGYHDLGFMDMIF